MLAKFSIYLGLGLAAVAQVASAQQCNADNCLRQVRGTNIPSRSSSQDCAAFQTTTVTPTVTSTTTATVTVAAVLRRDDQDRLLRRAAPAIPAYASSCRNSLAYASACSCIGVFAATVTAPTVTVGVTTTSSVTAQPTFVLKLNYPPGTPAYDYPGGAVSTEIYAGLTGYNGDSAGVLPFAGRSAAASFTIDPTTGYLFVPATNGQPNLYFVTYRLQGTTYAFVSSTTRGLTTGDSNQGSYTPCKKDPTTQQVTCTYHPGSGMDGVFASRYAQQLIFAPDQATLQQSVGLGGGSHVELVTLTAVPV